MRRFIEEITIRDPEIASRIIKALETKKTVTDLSESNHMRTVEPEYEVELYEHNRDFDMVRCKPDERPYVTLKIFVREDVR